jgi:hypothetical protein
VIDRPELASPEPGREVVGIDPIAHVPTPLFPVAIADDHPLDERDEEVVEPLGLGALLESDMDRPPHPPKELHQGRALGGKDGPGDHLPVSVRTEATVVA